MKPAEASQAAHVVDTQTVIESMRRHGVGFSANAYAVWHCYLSGTNHALRRAIDIVLSNGLAIDEKALRLLYARHFSPTRDATALLESAANGQRTLAELRLLPQHDDVRAHLDRLGHDVQEMVRHGERLTQQVARSEERIDQLERFLADARQDASTDSLTGIANRRAFEAALRIQAGKALNAGTDLAFLLVDIDHFKRVNDRLGHKAGDDVLRLIARTLTDAVGQAGLVARYGGEEFAVILAGTGPEAAVRRAEALRRTIEAQRMRLPDTDDAASGPDALRVTISAGLSCYQHGEALDAWQMRADGALYRAKAAGRNQVLFAPVEIMAGSARSEARRPAPMLSRAG